MNGTEKDYFDVKIQHIDRKLQEIHDDVLVIQTERKMERRFMVVLAGAIAFVVSTLTGLFWR
ncbi:hypothetical protein LCGC14_1564930 [marine sediment metagenome]|uniref:Uncharacterized protein n=1 Tax=marine sediment metagenome TaxID=412755 RepID=A0A0F9J7K6_9ZZZZ